MSTIALQHRLDALPRGNRSIVGAVTLTRYSVDGLGRVVVDTTDAPQLLATGWLYADLAERPGAPTAGVTTVDFGAFPGGDFASITLTAADAFNPNAILMAQVAPIATADHSADEHLVDPPLVGAVSNSDGTITVSAVGNAYQNSPLPPDPMPYGKWSVAWAFSQ
jgi:hypothetical protein